MERLKTATIWTLIAIIIRNQIGEEFLLEDFKKAVCDFTFNVLDSYQACAVLLFCCIIMPSLILFFLLNSIFKQHYSFKNVFKKVFLHHFCFGYYTLLIIYIFNLIEDKFPLSPEAEKIESVQKWHKYILHFFLAPPLFVDAVFSVETEKIKANKDIKQLPYSRKPYLFGQFFLVFYLIYAFVIIIKINTELPGITQAEIRIDKLVKTLNIFVKDAIWCVFIVLSMGLIDCCLFQLFIED